MGSPETGQLWLSKARALDRYRWLLLRERYGVFGSGMRFLREALGDWWFGRRARLRLARTVTAEPCDFLLLQSAPKVIAFQRKKQFMQGLCERGYRLTETAMQSPSQILRERLLKAPPGRVPTRYYGMAAYAEWLVEHYQPQILLNDRNGSLYAPFLRLSLNARNCLLVHLAHASTVESSRRLGMNDYDYYLMFGQSSLEALQARSLLFGTSQVVLTGSHMIDAAYELPPVDMSSKTLLVLGVGPDKEKEVAYQSTYRLLREWARQAPEYHVLIKPHPRSCTPFWHEVARELGNVQVLPSESCLAEALGKASVVVNIMSNAVIEATLASRSVLFVNASEETDIFAQERFLGPRITTVEELRSALALLEGDPQAVLERCERFAEFHLANGCEGLACSIETLEQLLRREPLTLGVSALDGVLG